MVETKQRSYKNYFYSRGNSCVWLGGLPSPEHCTAFKLFTGQCLCRVVPVSAQTQKISWNLFVVF